MKRTTQVPTGTRTTRRPSPASRSSPSTTYCPDADRPRRRRSSLHHGAQGQDARRPTVPLGRPKLTHYQRVPKGDTASYSGRHRRAPRSTRRGSTVASTGRRKGRLLSTLRRTALLSGPSCSLRDLTGCHSGWTRKPDHPSWSRWSLSQRRTLTPSPRLCPQLGPRDEHDVDAVPLEQRRGVVVGTMHQRVDS